MFFALTSDGATLESWGRRSWPRRCWRPGDERNRSRRRRRSVLAVARRGGRGLERLADRAAEAGRPAGRAAAGGRLHRRPVRVRGGAEGAERDSFGCAVRRVGALVRVCGLASGARVRRELGVAGDRRADRRGSVRLRGPPRDLEDDPHPLVPPAARLYAAKLLAAGTLDRRADAAAGVSSLLAGILFVGAHSLVDLSGVAHPAGPAARPDLAQLAPMPAADAGVHERGDPVLGRDAQRDRRRARAAARGAAHAAAGSDRQGRGRAPAADRLGVRRLARPVRHAPLLRPTGGIEPRQRRLDRRLRHRQLEDPQTARLPGEHGGPRPRLAHPRAGRGDRHRARRGARPARATSVPPATPTTASARRSGKSSTT